MTIIQKALIIVGRYDEVLIDVDRIESVEAIAAVDPAGRPKLPPVYDTPQFQGSVIRTHSGKEHLVPQTVEEVLDKMLRAAEPPELKQ